MEFTAESCELLDADLPVLQARLANRPSTDKWESEKALFYFRARFLVCSPCFAFILGNSDKSSGTSRVLRPARRGYRKEGRQRNRL